MRGCNNVHEQAYVHDVHHHEDGSMVVRAAGDGSHDIDELDDHKDKEKTYEFEGVYPCSSIENFLKKLPTRMLKAKVGCNLPMLLEHELRSVGDSPSHIRLLVAPTEDDNEICAQDAQKRGRGGGKEGRRGGGKRERNAWKTTQRYR